MRDNIKHGSKYYPGQNNIWLWSYWKTNGCGVCGNSSVSDTSTQQQVMRPVTYCECAVNCQLFMTLSEPLFLERYVRHCSKGYHVNSPIAHCCPTLSSLPPFALPLTPTLFPYMLGVFQASQAGSSFGIWRCFEIFKRPNSSGHQLWRVLFVRKYWL